MMRVSATFYVDRDFLARSGPIFPMEYAIVTLRQKIDRMNAEMREDKKKASGMRYILLESTVRLLNPRRDYGGRAIEFTAEGEYETIISRNQHICDFWHFPLNEVKKCPKT